MIGFVLPNYSKLHCCSLSDVQVLACKPSSDPAEDGGTNTLDPFVERDIKVCNI